MSSSIDAEQKAYEEEVKAVQQWWTDSRWRYTKRPFTAEQIVQKRGNLKIQYPSNEQSKKLWNIVEERFKVRQDTTVYGTSADKLLERGRQLHIWLLGSGHGHADGQVP